MESTETPKTSTQTEQDEQTPQVGAEDAQATEASAAASENTAEATEETGSAEATTDNPNSETSADEDASQGQTETESIEADDDDDEESEEGMDFAAMLEEAEAKALQRVGKGQKVEGSVVLISGETIYVNIGMRSEAQLPKDSNNERFESLQEGDKVTAFVVRPNQPVTLSLDPVMGYGDLTQVEEAFEGTKPIEGKVVKSIKGGFEINIDGVRAFCPISQMDLRPVRDPIEFVGETLDFLVIEFESRPTNVVVSRRRLLETEQKRLRAEARERLDPGTVVVGQVVEIKSFGAFVDLGGLTGLVHISELAHHHVDRVEDVVKIGDKIEVKILDMTRDSRGKDRISLSIKDLLPDPWDELELAEAKEYDGTIVRKSQYGIFINLAPGIDGLMPMRFMRQAGRNLDMDQFEEGQPIRIVVYEYDDHDRKITLALPGWDEEITSALRTGEVLAAEVIKVIPAGVLVQAIEDPAKGLIPKRTLRHQSPKQLFDAFPEGSKHDVVLEEIDDRGRFTFSLKSDSSGADAGSVKEYAGENDELGHNPFSDFFNKS
jgi:small subunit ribosomal protein S1